MDPTYIDHTELLFMTLLTISFLYGSEIVKSQGSTLKSVVICKKKAHYKI